MNTENTNGIEEKEETRGRKPLNDHKKRNVIQIKYTDKEFAEIKKLAGGSVHLTDVIRKATKDVVVKEVRVIIKGEPVYLTLLEGRDLLKQLAEKVY